jgi:hypothetical protein
MHSTTQPNSPRLHPIDIENVVRRCSRVRSGGRVVSTAQAVEEMRITTGDFISSDKELANALSAKAVALGYAVVFDEEAGAGISLG